MNAELTSTHGTGIDNILGMTIHGSSGTTNYYYLKDLSNTVLALANSSGSIVESYVYDAYGNVTIKNGSGTVISTPASTYSLVDDGDGDVDLGKWDLLKNTLLKLGSSIK